MSGSAALRDYAEGVNLKRPRLLSDPTASVRLTRTTVSVSVDRLSPLELGHRRTSERCPDRFFQSLKVAEEHAQAFVAGVGPHDNLRIMSEA
jgi:hypothetical protein